MCLQTIEKVYDPPIDVEQDAWKVFCSYTAREQLNGFLFGNQVSRGEWISAKGDSIVSLQTVPELHGFEKYPAGFHCFLTEEDALAYMNSSFWACCLVLKVRVRGIVAVGTQRFLFGCETTVPCIVAKEMFVPVAVQISEDSKPAIMELTGVL